MLTRSKPTAGWSPLKRVIDGKVYNTDTATLIHQHDDEDKEEEYAYAEQMFRTRFGKFFLVVRNETYLNPANEDVDLRDRIIPLGMEDAIKWMEKHCNEKITDYVDVPEAGEPSTTLTLRLDKVLKIRLNAIAVRAGVSMNLWCVRTLNAAAAQLEEKSDEPTRSTPR